MDLAKDLLESAGGKIILPTDVLIADKFAEDAKTDTVQAGDVPDGWMVRSGFRASVAPLSKSDCDAW